MGSSKLIKILFIVFASLLFIPRAGAQKVGCPGLGQCMYGVTPSGTWHFLELNASGNVSLGSGSLSLVSPTGPCPTPGACPYAVGTDGNFHYFQVDANGNLQTTGSGGGSGTVTSVTCGAGLTGGNFTTSGTCALSTPVTAGNGGTGVANTATLTLGTSNHNYATLGTGIIKNTTTTGALSNAAASDIYNLFTSCTGSSGLFLEDGGTCSAPASAAPIFSTAATGTSLVTSGTNTVIVGPVTMTTPGANGSYRFEAQITQTTTGSGGTCTTGAIFINLAYRDPDGGVTYSPTTVINVIFYPWSSNPSVTSTLTLAGAANGSANTWSSIPRTFRAASGTAIQYQIVELTNSNCTTPPVFTVRPALYYLGY